MPRPRRHRAKARPAEPAKDVVPDDEVEVVEDAAAGASGDASSEGLLALEARFVCPSCGHKYPLGDSRLLPGVKATCAKCKKPIVVPNDRDRIKLYLTIARNPIAALRRAAEKARGAEPAADPAELAELRTARARLLKERKESERLRADLAQKVNAQGVRYKELETLKKKLEADLASARRESEDQAAQLREKLERGKARIAELEEDNRKRLSEEESDRIRREAEDKLRDAERHETEAREAAERSAREIADREKAIEDRIAEERKVVSVAQAEYRELQSAIRALDEPFAQVAGAFAGIREKTEAVDQPRVENDLRALDERLRAVEADSRRTIEEQEAEIERLAGRVSDLDRQVQAAEDRAATAEDELEEVRTEALASGDKSFMGKITSIFRRRGESAEDETDTPRRGGPRHRKKARRRKTHAGERDRGKAPGRGGGDAPGRPPADAKGDDAPSSAGIEVDDDEAEAARDDEEVLELEPVEDDVDRAVKHAGIDADDA